MQNRIYWGGEAEADYGLPAVSVCSCLIAAFR